MVDRQYLSITVNNNLIVGMMLWVCLFPVKGSGPHERHDDPYVGCGVFLNHYFLIMPVTPHSPTVTLCVVGGGVVVFVRCWAFHGLNNLFYCFLWRV